MPDSLKMCLFIIKKNDNYFKILLVSIRHEIITFLANEKIWFYFSSIIPFISVLVQKNFTHKKVYIGEQESVIAELNIYIILL